MLNPTDYMKQPTILLIALMPIEPTKPGAIVPTAIRVAGSFQHFFPKTP